MAYQDDTDCILFYNPYILHNISEFLFNQKLMIPVAYATNSPPKSHLIQFLNVQPAIKKPPYLRTITTGDPKLYKKEMMFLKKS